MGPTARVAQCGATESGYSTRAEGRGPRAVDCRAFTCSAGANSASPKPASGDGSDGGRRLNGRNAQGVKRSLLLEGLGHEERR